MRRARALALCAAVSVFLAPRPGLADTYDIFAQLYQDSSCFERADQILLVDEGCYANLYSNVSKAFSVKIIDFDPPQRFDIRQYSDDCRTMVDIKRTVTAGMCQDFAGPFYAQFELRFRAATCTGPDCSPLQVAIQTFYPMSECMGVPMLIYKYPVTNECMRYNNGTQRFQVDQWGINITQVDYLGNDDCTAGGATREYVITSFMCFPLYSDREPRSFSWVLESGSTIGQTSQAWRPRTLQVMFAASIPAVSLLAAATPFAALP